MPTLQAIALLAVGSSDTVDLWLILITISNQATTRIFPYEKAEKINTIDVLKKLQLLFSDQKITIVWDGAPYHRALLVKETAYGHSS